MTKKTQYSVLAILLAFMAFIVVRHLHGTGDDLSSSYVGCKLLALGQQDHLYSHDLHDFSKVSDPIWDGMATRYGFNSLGLLHPYVQTPLWAYSLQPLCVKTSFPEFNIVFVFLLALSWAATIWITAWYWCRGLFHPLWIAGICAGMCLSQPMRYAELLTQTHMIFLFLTVLALVLAEGRYALWAGALLAIAAAVKITPGFLLIYWLITGRRKAAVSFVGFSALFLFLTWITTGSHLLLAYFHELTWLSNVLLVPFNNQSLAAWWMGNKVEGGRLFIWHIYTLPIGVKVVSMVLLLASTILGGFMDRNPECGPIGRQSAPSRHVPYGGIFAMVGTTMFTPIAWTHYYIVLVLPLMLLIDAARKDRSWALLTLAAIIVALNCYPIAINVNGLVASRISLVRSEFYSGALSLAGLALLYVRRQMVNRSRSFVSPAGAAPIS